MLQKSSYALIMAAGGQSVPAYGYAGNNPINSSDPTGLAATVNPNFIATAADRQRECNEGNEVTCENWGLMPDDGNDGNGPGKKYETKEEAGAAALTMLRRLSYSRYGGHRLPTTSFEYVGRVIGGGSSWFYTAPTTIFSRERGGVALSPETNVYHSHTNDTLAMAAENFLFGKNYHPERMVLGNEIGSSSDEMFRTNFILTPTNKMLMWVRGQGYVYLE